MTQNYYPDQMRAVLIMIDGLDRIDKAIGAMPGLPAIPYFKGPIEVVDGDGTGYGELVDEIGGSWSWRPK